MRESISFSRVEFSEAADTEGTAKRPGKQFKKDRVNLFFCRNAKGFAGMQWGLGE
jgi:hypothetical protein